MRTWKCTLRFRAIQIYKERTGRSHWCEKYLLYMLKQASINRYNEMIGDLQTLIRRYSQTPKVAEIISGISGLDASRIK